MVHRLNTYYAALLFSYVDSLLRKTTATNPMGAPFLTPQDLGQALSLVISCRDCVRSCPGDGQIITALPSFS